MDRQLHPGLFNENQVDSESLELTPEVSLASVNAIKRLESQLESLEERIKNKSLELDKRISHRLDKMDQHIEFSGKKLESQITSLQSKQSQLISKVTDRRVSETKIQALLERHNHVVHQFDLKMNQLQKIIEEQKFQMMNYKSELESARREIARLKRI